MLILTRLRLLKKFNRCINAIIIFFIIIASISPPPPPPRLMSDDGNNAISSMMMLTRLCLRSSIQCISKSMQSSSLSSMHQSLMLGETMRCQLPKGHLMTRGRGGGGGLDTPKKWCRHLWTALNDKEDTDNQWQHIDADDETNMFNDDLVKRRKSWFCFCSKDDEIERGCYMRSVRWSFIGWWP